jgi:predicted Zn-dependent protease
LGLGLAGLVTAGACADLGQSLRGMGERAGHSLDRTRTRIAPSATHMAKAIEKGSAWCAGKLKANLAALNESLHHPATESLTPEQSYYLGRTVTAELLSKRFDNRLVGVQGKGRRAKGSDDLHYVQAVAAALLPAAERSHDPQLPPERFPAALHVAVVPGEAPSAYSTPGGFILVSTGMVRLAQDEDELAAVLAHEVAHTTLAHGLAAIDRGDVKLLRSIGAAGRALGKETKLPLGKLMDAFDRFTDAIVHRLTEGYDRSYEFAADARALGILNEAGYDPAALGRVLRRLDAWQKAHGVQGMGKTHPSPQARLARVEGAPSQAPDPGHRKVRAQRFADHAPPLVRGALARR